MRLLKNLLKQTKTPYIELSCHIMQVFPAESFRAMFYDLTDYYVSSAVSGPSFMMIQKQKTL